MGPAGAGAEVPMASLRPWNGKMKRDGKMMNVRSTDGNLSIAWSGCEAFAGNPRTGGGGVPHLCKSQAPAWSPQRSSGLRPVRLEMRASMRGPSSSRSRNAKTTFGQPSRANTLWDPVWRLTFQPMRNKEASTRFAFVDGQSLTRRRKAGEGWEFPHHFPACPREPGGPGPLLWRWRGVGSLHRPKRPARRESRPSTAHRFPARSRFATSGSPPKPPPMRTGGS